MMDNLNYYVLKFIIIFKLKNLNIIDIPFSKEFDLLKLNLFSDIFSESDFSYFIILLNLIKYFFFPFD